MNDRYAQCFSMITPPLNHTFSHRRKPCRYEPSLNGPRATGDCPYRASKYCERIEQSILNAKLKKAYPEPLKNTLSEPSTCVVVRSEQQFHGMDRQRFAQRRHLYEVIANGTPGDESRFGCHCADLHENDRLGEYLGFVDLRQHFEESPLAIGLLVQPRSLREDPNAFVIQGEYGPLFGAHSFQSTVYCMQDKAPTIGARCAQMCAIMALGMLGDRRAEIKGSFTLTYLAWMLSQGSPSDIASRVENGRDAAPLDSFSPGGMPPDRLRDVLRECNVEAEWIDLDHMAPARCDLPVPSERFATRLIEAYVHARFPIILSVDAWAWRSGEPSPDTWTKKSAHAVTIVGVRRSAESHEVNRLIVHDPGWRPFGERTLDIAYFAARQHHVLDPPQPRNRISMVAVTDLAIKKHPKQCMEWLRDDDSERDEIVGSFLGLPTTDYDIRLLHRNSLLHAIAPDLVAKSSKASQWLRTLSGKRYWAVSLYRERARRTTWLFDAETEEAPFAAKVFRSEAGALFSRRREGSADVIEPLE